MRVLIGFVGAGVVALIAAAIVTLAGLYDVSATKPHFRIVYWWIELGMRRSVQVHAAAIKVPPLGDEAQVIRGFRHSRPDASSATARAICRFIRRCGACSRKAPDLADKVSDWSANELFWIVKHGIKMTGMPAWEAQERDDEVWDLVAFLQVLPRMTPERRRQMMREDESEAAVRASDGQLIAMAGPPQKAEAACARCHGFDGAGHPSGAFPRLGGQDANYLHAQLKRYADGTRPSGVMAPVARALSDEEMRLVAEQLRINAGERILGASGSWRSRAPADGCSTRRGGRARARNRGLCELSRPRGSRHGRRAGACGAVCGISGAAAHAMEDGASA
jgi:cytochrome c553